VPVCTADPPRSRTNDRGEPIRRSCIGLPFNPPRSGITVKPAADHFAVVGLARVRALG
jgi:hypothetical protein